MTTMTLHRALAEVKLIEKRINKTIKETTFVAAVDGVQSPSGFGTQVDFLAHAVSNFDSTEALIKRRDRIKANATHTVEISGKTMSIAEAIYLRDKGLEEHELLLNALRRQKTNAAIHLETLSAQLRERTERHLKEWFANGERPTATEIAEVTENFEKRNAPKFLDPIDIDAKIEQLDTFIDEFRNEVHFILGEANNSVKIEIED